MPFSFILPLLALIGLTPGARAFDVEGCYNLMRTTVNFTDDSSTLQGSNTISVKFTTNVSKIKGGRFVVEDVQSGNTVVYGPTSMVEVGLTCGRTAKDKNSESLVRQLSHEYLSDLEAKQASFPEAESPQAQALKERKEDLKKICEVEVAS